MKKLLFSALACVAFAFSGFASNEVVNEMSNVKKNEKSLVEKSSTLEIDLDVNEKPCSFTIVFKNNDGHSVEYIFNVPKSNFNDCFGTFYAMLDYCYKRNYEIVDTKFSWGDVK